MKTKLFIYLGIGLWLFSSCQESADELQELEIGIENIAKIASTERIYEVDANEAAEVANLFVSKEASTRTATPQISEIQTIQDDKFGVLMYAINFANNNGYVLVSATKKYYPILAYAEQGHFDANQKGMDIWLEDEKNMMKICLDDSTATYNTQWMQYTKKDAVSNSLVKTRVESNYPETLNWWWMEVGNEITNPDYHSDYEDLHAASGTLINNYFCHVDEARKVLPNCASIYDEMAEICHRHGFSEDDVIYHIREFDERTIINPLLTTNWTQGAPYNWKVKKALGCVTVAVAQVMYHHRKPSYYKWSEINVNNDTTEVQGSFFKDLGERLGINYNTNNASANFGDAKRVLQGYGYSANEKGSCSSAEMLSALTANQPVCMGGQAAKDGHAWVCDGYDCNYTKVVLTVYAPFGTYPDSNGLYATNPYSPQRDYVGGTSYSTLYYHMNWGWAGNYSTSWNRAGDYRATNGEVYKRDVKYLFVKP
ncbi:MAG: C10 family peptidase [Bacteroides sp.]|nr:C10 family peptidase [Bacteroides sp.]